MHMYLIIGKLKRSLNKHSHASLVPFYGTNGIASPPSKLATVIFSTNPDFMDNLHIEHPTLRKLP